MASNLSKPGDERDKILLLSGRFGFIVLFASQRLLTGDTTCTLLLNAKHKTANKLPKETIERGLDDLS